MNQHGVSSAEVIQQLRQVEQARLTQEQGQLIERKQAIEETLAALAERRGQVAAQLKTLEAQAAKNNVILAMAWQEYTAAQPQAPEA